MPAGAEGHDVGKLSFPFDHPCGQGLEQDLPQVTPEHLGTSADTVVGLLKKYRALRIQHTQCSAARMDDRAESIGQVGRLQRPLPGVRMDIELSALPACVSRRFRLIDGRRNAPNMEHACQDEAAETRPDDRNCRHRVI